MARKTPMELAEAVLLPQIKLAASLRLDMFAKTRQYDNILSACTYATSTVPKFQQEGQYTVEARDATWAKLYEIWHAVIVGERPVLQSFAEIEPGLPELAWPNEP
jgi:hypothetical protein